MLYLKYYPKLDKEALEENNRGYMIPSFLPSFIHSFIHLFI